jgi:hypothetical protein
LIAVKMQIGWFSQMVDQFYAQCVTGINAQ